MPIPPRSRGTVSARAERSGLTRRVTRHVQSFIYTESWSGVVLFAATLAAIIWANSPVKEAYRDLWNTTAIVDLGFFRIEEDLRHWVNDGLMALFFFVVGLEIKREIVHGELSQPRRAILPLGAALGGMIVPAAIFLAFNAGTNGERGWGIPMATDIAFALGVLALVGKNLPSELRVFLLTLAIADDIGAILVIAAFYTDHLSVMALGSGLIFTGILVLLVRLGAGGTTIFLLVGLLLWAAVLKSGIHPTIAGVLLGLLTPATNEFPRSRFLGALSALSARFGEANRRGDIDAAEVSLGEMEDLIQSTEAPVERLERLLHPLTGFIIIPIFALANAGLELSPGEIGDAATSRVTLGIVMGLVIGKFVGITLFSWLLVRSGLALLPPSLRWSHVIGMALLAGIGFTVSLFITGLAYTDPGLESDAKIGILGASALAAVIGFSALRRPSQRPATTNK